MYEDVLVFSTPIYVVLHPTLESNPNMSPVGIGTMNTSITSEIYISDILQSELPVTSDWQSQMLSFSPLTDQVLVFLAAHYRPYDFTSELLPCS